MDRCELTIYQESDRMNETLATLISVIIGAFLAFMSSFLTEKRRWGRELEKELQRDKRKAISQALSWLDPIKNALTIVNSISISFVKGTIKHEELMQKWPPLLSQLSGMDVRQDLRLLLPEGTYAKCLEITMQIDELQSLVVNAGQSLQHSSPEVQKRGRDKFQELNEKLNSLQVVLDNYELTLRKQYLATYE